MVFNDFTYSTVWKIWTISIPKSIKNGVQNRPKICPKIVPKGIKMLIDLGIDFGVGSGNSAVHGRGSVSLPGGVAKKGQFFFSKLKNYKNGSWIALGKSLDWELDQWSQKSPKNLWKVSQNGAKIHPKSIQKSMQRCVKILVPLGMIFYWFFIDFWSQDNIADGTILF